MTACTYFIVDCAWTYKRISSPRQLPFILKLENMAVLAETEQNCIQNPSKLYTAEEEVFTGNEELIMPYVLWPLKTFMKNPEKIHQ